MNKLWLVAANEYRRNVFKKSFIMVLLSVPLIMALNIGMGLFLESVKDNNLPVGYIDNAGVFPSTETGPGISTLEDSVTFIPYQNEEEARAALDDKDIQAYYLLPADYLETRELELVSADKHGKNVPQNFYDFLQLNMLSELPPEIARRTAAGTGVTVRSVDGRRSVPSGGPTFGLLMPMLINMAFLGLLLMSSGYLMSAVAEEKENRTMEILATSISPTQIITGKVLGIVAIGISLLIAWSIVATVAIQIAANAGIGFFQNLELDWSIITAAVIIALPAYVLVAAMMTAVGAMATTTQEGQSLSSIFVILHMAPLYIGMAFLNNPHSTTAVVLSILPFTSLMTVAMRNLFTVVPAWQVAVSAGVQTLCALGGLWLAGRAFRLGMLRYGQRLTWRKLIREVNPWGE
jgi:ABC-2 type transport system permease protein